MTRAHRRIVDFWRQTIGCAIALGEADAAYRLTRGLVGRLRELGVL